MAWLPYAVFCGLCLFVIPSQPAESDILRNSLIPVYFDYFAKILNNSSEALRENLFKGVSSKCKRETLEWIVPFLLKSSALPPWTIKLIDSWGKPNSGLLNSAWRKDALGDFDQCVSVKRENIQKRIGKYCLSVISDGNQLSTGSVKTELSNTSLPLLFGSCHTSMCSTNDVQKFFANVILQESTNITVQVLDCYMGDEYKLDAWSIFIIFILGSLVLLSIFGWCWSTIPRRRRRSCASEKLVSAFSITKNVSSWIYVVDVKEISVLNGMLFFSVAWIILFRSWELPFLFNYFPWKEAHALSSNMAVSGWTSGIIRNGDIAFDTLLTITGITISLELFKDFKRFQNKAFLNTYIQIILRLTPVYILIIGIMATIYPIFAHGPLSAFIFQETRNCQQNGWKNIFYVNNFVNPALESLCLPDSWYFAVEIQLLLFAPILIYCISKFPKIGLPMVSALILGSLILPAAMFWTNQFPALPQRGSVQYDDYYRQFYILPWNRASPFLVGLTGGYILHITSKGFKMSKLLALAGWLISIAIGISIIYGLFSNVDPEIRLPKVEVAVYAGCHRFAWGIAISWIVFACSRGYGWWIGEFLGWKLFTPLGKVSMIALLIALPLQFIHSYRFQQFLAPDVFVKINIFIGDLVVVYFLAILLYLFLGLPCANLGTLIKHKVSSDDGVGIEMYPKNERFGIYYEMDISVCMPRGETVERRRNSTLHYSHRPRYGIFYDKDVSVTMVKTR